MTRSHIIGFTIGIIMLIIGASSLIPAALDYNDGHKNATSFFLTSVSAMFFGLGLIFSNNSFSLRLSIRQTFFLTTTSWVCLAFFGAIPLYVSDLNISFAQAFFESMSGITTTGSTILTGLEHQSRGILLWRSMLQFIGGIGIVAFAIILLPFLGIGGMQLFQTESSDKSDKIMPKSQDIIKSLLTVYIGLNILCAVTYYILGMNLFDAINHAMATISTGGFSTYDASFGNFKSHTLQYAGVCFMFLGGVPFFLFIKLIYKGEYNLWRDDQFRLFTQILIALISCITLWLWLHSDYNFEQCLVFVSFNVISIMTTTGFATTDYTLWGQFPIMAFFFITYLGACAGSTAGGVKIMRIDIVTRSLLMQINKLIYPHGHFKIRYQGKPISGDLIMNVLVFLGLYVFCNVILTLLLTLAGLDFMTALSGAATSIANVGPGIGTIIGPSGNFSTISDTALWILSFGMLLGRLEILTVLILFTGRYWKD